jgi:hypothetical protein
MLNMIKAAFAALVLALFAVPAMAEKGIPAGVGAVVECGTPYGTVTLDLNWRMKRGNCPTVIPAADLACLAEKALAIHKATGDTRLLGWVPLFKTTDDHWYRMPVEVQIHGDTAKAWVSPWDKVRTDERTSVRFKGFKSVGGCKTS